MELWQDILCNILKNQEIKLVVSGLPDIRSMFESERYKLLNKIKEIIEDEELEDKECFLKIEAIIALFEDIGIDTGTRHDF